MMSAGGPMQHRGRDLDSPEEIGELVTRFYRDVAQDDLLHPYFNHIARVDWYAHVGKVTDYWCGLLLSTPREDRDVIEAHRWLHDHTAFEPELFERWLEIFVTTVDAGWAGPTACRAKKRAQGLARAMARRLLGEGAWRPSAPV